MIPQGFPLLAQTEDGAEHIVVGWVTNPPGEGVSPVCVPAYGLGLPRVMLAPMTYSLPAT